MLNDGAEILDIGGESTRPGAGSVTEQEEVRRVVPAITAIKKRFPHSIVSIDTYHTLTAQEAVNAGADIINDVTALTGDERMAEVAAAAKVPVILMHMRGTPKTMQQNCEYTNVVAEVAAYLKQRAQLLEETGIGADKIILTRHRLCQNTEQNLALLQGLDALVGLGYPVLLAASRKTVIGETLGGLPPQERLEGTIALSCQGRVCRCADGARA